MTELMRVKMAERSCRGVVTVVDHRQQDQGPPKWEGGHTRRVKVWGKC